jgi:peptidoglycan/LPS O-acetylase OafA/YrhL
MVDTPATSVAVGGSGSRQPEPPPLVRGYIREFDTLRALSVLAVMVGHFWPLRPHSAPVFWRTGCPLAVMLAWMAVDVFFVVSGFLIAGILLDTKEEEGYFRNFYARRVLRIFPLYYLYLLLTFGVTRLVLGSAEYQSWMIERTGSPIWYLFYVGNFHIAFFGNDPIFIDSLWSLSIEEQFYLVFPFLVYRSSARQLRVVLLAIIFAAPLIRFGLYLIAPNNTHLIYALTPARADVLAFGALLAIEMRLNPERLRRLPAGWIFVSLVAVIAAVYRINYFALNNTFVKVFGYSISALTSFFAVYLVLINRERPSTRFFRLQPLCDLGKISYGVYLAHTPLMVLWKIAERYPLSMLLGRIVVTILVATASWYWFERPILRLKSRFRSRHHPKQLTTADKITAVSGVIDKPAVSHA